MLQPDRMFQRCVTKTYNTVRYECSLLSALNGYSNMNVKVFSFTRRTFFNILTDILMTLFIFA